MTVIAPILPSLSPVASKQFTVYFDDGRLSSDGGIIVFRELAQRLGFPSAVTMPFRDERHADLIAPKCAEIIETCVLRIAVDYEDCNDVDVLHSLPLAYRAQLVSTRR
jgi:Transposase DDE domain group 1